MKSDHGREPSLRRRVECAFSLLAGSGWPIQAFLWTVQRSSAGAVRGRCFVSSITCRPVATMFQNGLFGRAKQYKTACRSPGVAATVIFVASEGSGTLH